MTGIDAWLVALSANLKGLKVGLARACCRGDPCGRPARAPPRHRGDHKGRPYSGQIPPHRTRVTSCESDRGARLRRLNPPCPTQGAKEAELLLGAPALS